MSAAFQRANGRGDKDIEAFCAWALDEVKKAGADAADILYSEGEGTGLTLKDGEIEESVTGFTSGIGVRAIMSDGRQGIASGNRVDKESVRELIEWSLHNCRNSQPEEGIGLYTGKLVEDPSVALIDPRIAEITPGDRLEYCKEMTSLALSADKRVVSVRGAAWNDGVGASFYCTTTGLAGWERGSSASCGVTVLTRQGEFTEMGGYGLESRRFDELDIKKTALLAVSRTAVMLGAQPIPTGPLTLVIEPEAAASIVDILAELFCAPEVHKGRSMMKGMLGKAVASSCVTLTDDGRIPWKAGSGSWDAEGVPTGKTTLIEKGVAKAYLYDLQYARKDGVESTGNACRGLSSLPDAGVSNVILQPGAETRESLCGRVGRGLFITEFMGLHTVDPVSGDFSIGARGLLIEKGSFTRPVSGVTIASNLMDFVKKISAVGSDLQFFGAVAAPTLVVEDVVVAGE